MEMSQRPLIPLIQELAVLRHRMEALEAAAAMCQQAEDALSESEMRFWTLVQESLQGILVHSNHQPLFVNQAFAAMFGYATPEEVLRLGTVLPLIAPQDRARMIAYGDARLCGDAAPPQYELQGLRQDGTPFWVEARATVIQWDGAPAILSTHIDITTRKQAKEALRDSEARFRTLADAVPVLIWLADVSKRCTYFNKGWLEFTGRTMEQELGYGWAEGVHPDERSACLETYTTAFETRQPFELEYRRRRADGAYRWIVDCGVPLFTPNGSFIGHIGSGIDMTAHKQAEQFLQQMHTEIEQRVQERTAALRHEMAECQHAEAESRRLECDALRAQHLALLGRLAASVSYEIRNPLGAIMLHVDLLEEELQQPTPESFAQIAQWLAEIKTNLTRLDELIQDYLLLVRVSLSQRHVQDLGAAVQARAVEVQGLAAERHVALLGRLTASVSQEIRHPLGAIMLHVDLLEAGLQQLTPENSAQIAQALAAIKTNLTCLDELMQNYLWLVRVSLSQRHVQDLGAAVQAWAVEVQRLAAARGVTVRLEGAESLGGVAFHNSTLRRAVLHLVQNALDAMPTGGTLTLAGQGTATQVQLQVRDTEAVSRQTRCRRSSIP